MKLYPGALDTFITLQKITLKASLITFLNGFDKSLYYMTHDIEYKIFLYHMTLKDA